MVGGQYGGVVAAAGQGGRSGGGGGGGRRQGLKVLWTKKELPALLGSI